MQYDNIWNANPSKAHLECNHTQCVNLCCAQASNARALCGCPVPFAVLLVPHARRALAGCGGLVVAWSRPAAQPKFFRSMLLAMSWLLTSNGQRPNCCSGCCVGLLFCFQDKRRLLDQWRPGCCSVPACWNHEICCCMLLAMPFLLNSNGRRLKVLPRLMCVPARLPPAALRMSGSGGCVPFFFFFLCRRKNQGQ